MEKLGKMFPLLPCQGPTQAHPRPQPPAPIPWLYNSKPSSSLAVKCRKWRPRGLHNHCRQRRVACLCYQLGSVTPGGRTSRITDVIGVSPLSSHVTHHWIGRIAVLEALVHATFGLVWVVPGHTFATVALTGCVVKPPPLNSEFLLAQVSELTTGIQAAGSFLASRERHPVAWAASPTSRGTRRLARHVWLLQSRCTKCLSLPPADSGFYRTSISSLRWRTAIPITDI